MHFNRFTRNAIFFLFAFYYLQGSIYPSGSIISQTSLLIILLISSAYFIITSLPENKNNLFYNAWTYLILINVIGFVFTADFTDSKHTSMFKNILGCMLPFYPFYYYAKKDELKATHLIRFFLILLPINLFQFFTFKSQILLQSNTDDPNNLVNNSAYLFVSLIPFVFLIKEKKLISGALMAIIVLLIIQGAKRGAFIAGSIGLLLYFYYQMKTVESHHRIRSYLVAIIVMIALCVFAYQTFMSNEFLINRMVSISEGNLSNRDIIYKAIFNSWYNSESVWNILLGFGFAASIDITGSLAHSDWVELLSNFGLVGICGYLFLFYAAIKYCLNNEWMIDKRMLMTTITMVWFFVSLGSMWYASLNWFSQTILLGYLIGSENNGLV